MDPIAEPISLTALADAAGATPRTIRYYIAQGLLPAPYGGGPATRYGRGHLDRLRLIRMLQRQHLPLAEIRVRLAGLSDEQVAELVAREPERPRPADSASDYIRNLLKPHRPAEPAPLAPAAPAPAVPPRPTPRLRAIFHAPATAEAPGSARQPVVHESIATYGDVAASPAPAPQSGPGRSQWERVALDPDIELHVRRPLSRHHNRAVERIVTLARQILEEDPS